MGVDFQDAFYLVYGLPIAVMLAFVLAGVIALSILRLLVSSFALWRSR